MKILVVEDDPRVADTLRRGLEEDGHVVVGAASRAAALRAAEGADAWIVDRRLPDGDGLDLVRELRARGGTQPVLVLTARDRVDERVDGLLSGADDYMVKPFALEELLARVTALARRVDRTGSVLEVGDLRFDVEALRLRRGDDEIVLTPQELRLFRALLEHRGRVLSRVRLLELAWDMHHDPGTNIVDVYIGYLRAKLDAGREGSLIRTVRGLGYVLEDRS